MIPLISNIQNRHIHRDLTQIGVCQGLMRSGIGRDHLTGKGFYLTVMEMVWNYVEVVVVQHCECVNVTELSI